MRVPSKSLTAKDLPAQAVSAQSLFSQIAEGKPHLSNELWLESIENGFLKKIARKALANHRISGDEGLFMLEQADEAVTAELANRVRSQSVGNQVLYATTLFIHPTNLCELSCPMCSYYAKPGQSKAWFHSPEKILDQIKSHLPANINEVHIVGGLWKDANLNYYRAIFEGIKALSPNLHIKALTPVEFDYLATLHNISVKEVLIRMKSWGLGSIPGGGAEVLVEHVRRKIAPQKISSQRYLDIHFIAHRLGIPSNITMLFGHVEENKDLIVHLERVRQLQDQTGGVNAFVPLRYHLENNALGKRAGKIKPKNLKRIYAISRLMLDNVPNIKVLWNYVGLTQAQSALEFGANDLGSTALEEKIVIAAGGIHLRMDQIGMRRAIAQMGRFPEWAHSGFMPKQAHRVDNG